MIILFDYNNTSFIFVNFDCSNCKLFIYSNENIKSNNIDLSFDKLLKYINRIPRKIRVSLTISVRICQMFKHYYRSNPYSIAALYKRDFTAICLLQIMEYFAPLKEKKRTK